MQLANSVVPKFSVLVGNSFGAGNYAMCGKSLRAEVVFSVAFCVVGGYEWRIGRSDTSSA